MGEIVALVSHLEKVSNKEMRKEYCEFCGTTFGDFETHHIKSEGSGGPEIRANKINLCLACHDKAQQYVIKPRELIIRVARREAVTVEAVYAAIGWPVPNNIRELEDKSGELGASEEIVSLLYRPHEEVVSMLIETIEGIDTLEFYQGQVMDLMVRMGRTLKSIASDIGKSVGYVSARVKTYRAFPDESSRAKDMSWTHHRYAAMTDNPSRWIDESVKNQYSTRQLSRAIKGLPINKPETDWRLKAEKALNDVNVVLDAGGDAARWLLKELYKLSAGCNRRGVA